MVKNLTSKLKKPLSVDEVNALLSRAFGEETCGNYVRGRTLGKRVYAPHESLRLIVNNGREIGYFKAPSDGSRLTLYFGPGIFGSYINARRYARLFRKETGERAHVRINGRSR